MAWEFYNEAHSTHWSGADNELQKWDGFCTSLHDGNIG